MLERRRELAPGEGSQLLLAGRLTCRSTQDVLTKDALTKECHQIKQTFIFCRLGCHGVRRSASGTRGSGSFCDPSPAAVDGPRDASGRRSRGSISSRG